MQEDVAQEMSFEEFVEKGYLQEVNRRFFHPLGLALRVQLGHGKMRPQAVVLDCRRDPQGVVYAPATTEEHAEVRESKARFIDRELQERERVRKAAYGWGVQPLDVMTVIEEAELGN